MILGESEGEEEDSDAGDDSYSGEEDREQDVSESISNGSDDSYGGENESDDFEGDDDLSEEG